MVHPTQLERRKLERLPLKILVRIRTQESDQVELAEALNVSAGGIYFHTSANLQIGQSIECLLVFPQDLTQTVSPLLVGCQAQVLRVKKNISDGTIGVAVEVHSCDFSLQADQALGAGAS
jgi:hypothetical protein